MRHLHLINGQAQALCIAPTRLELPPQHRLNAVCVFIQLVLLLLTLFRVLKSPLPPLLVVFCAPIQRRPRKKFAHILPFNLPGPRTQEPPADIILGVRYLVPASPEELLPLLLARRGWVSCRGLERALAGQVDEQPKRRLDHAPGEQKAAECRLRGLCDAKGDAEDAQGRNGAEAHDDGPHQQVLGKRILDHGGAILGLRKKVGDFEVSRGSPVAHRRGKAHSSCCWEHVAWLKDARHCDFRR
jgi:hypothetical protein